MTLTPRPPPGFRALQVFNHKCPPLETHLNLGLIVMRNLIEKPPIFTTPFLAVSATDPNIQLLRLTDGLAGGFA